MGKLISGKEAVQYLLDGKEVLYIGHSYKNKPDTSWGNALELSVEEFIEDRWSFKLKPQTITINGIEVSKPFEPKEDCIVYLLDDSKTSGYRSYPYEFDGDSDSNFFGLWKREEEIKQVVEALRSIFK